MRICVWLSLDFGNSVDDMNSFFLYAKNGIWSLVFARLSNALSVDAPVSPVESLMYGIRVGIIKDDFLIF